MIEVNDLLHLFSGFFIEIDSTDKTILFLRQKNRIIAENIPFSKVEYFFKLEDVILGKDFSMKDISFFFGTR